MRDSTLSSREELLKDLVKTRELSQKIIDGDNFIFEVTSEPLVWGCFPHLFFYLFLFFCGSMTMLYLTDGDIIHFIKNGEQFALIIGTGLILYIVFVMSVKGVVLIYKKDKHHKKIVEIQKNRKIYVETLKNDSPVPMKYWNPHYLQMMEGYVSNKRADSLKESLNLLEEELRHNEKISQLKVIQEQNEQPQFYIFYRF
jgi:hypothetical protein